MSELFVGAAALLVAAPTVWALARLALRPFLAQARAPRPGSPMLNGVLGDVLLVAGVAGYSLTLLHLIARDVQHVRRRRKFDGWRIVQRQRIARRARW